MAVELKPSNWDEVYSTEIENFETDGDEGEIWFGEETVEKMVHLPFSSIHRVIDFFFRTFQLEWTLTNVPATENPYILDIGTGNGIMAITLAENGYDATRIVGIDYSEPSIKLAKSVATGRGHPGIRYVVSDFVNEAPPVTGEDQANKWDLLLDKGTYDAIALAEKNDDGTSLVSKYPYKIVEALKTGGLFLITSCNFTEEELKAAFGAPDLGLVYQ
ncbi:hypothetical protein FRC10_005724 [Ceratobasidium sp. 414]|nr:hypothetical protein FRC10_005724 [Ceratobasidium sp. 414]